MRHMEQSISAAHKVQRELVKAGRVDRGVRQANFWVLFKTAMPAMLVELDFISNPTVEKYLASEKGQKELASAICRGICSYRGYSPSDDSDLIGDIDTEPDDDDESPEPETSLPSHNNPSAKTSDSPREKRASNPAPVEKTGKGAKKEIAPANGPVYKIQFLVADRELPAKSKKFKGLSPVEYYKENGTYKYTFGRYNSPTEAAPDLRAVKKLFKDAFIITTDGTNRIK